MTFYDELVWRGLIKDVSSEDLKDKLNAGGMTFYIGTDPTGDSLHIGHFSSFLMSKRLRMQVIIQFFWSVVQLDRLGIQSQQLKDQ